MTEDRTEPTASDDSPALLKETAAPAGLARPYSSGPWRGGGTGGTVTGRLTQQAGMDRRA